MFTCMWFLFGHAYIEFVNVTPTLEPVVYLIFTFSGFFVGLFMWGVLVK